jgi:hypothetical protein
MDDEARDTILSAMVSARSVLLACYDEDVASLYDPFRKKVIALDIGRIDQAIELIKTHGSCHDNEQASS